MGSDVDRVMMWPRRYLPASEASEEGTRGADERLAVYGDLMGS